ncbi:DUF4097 family beta strand repeat-containing protein [Mycobacterium sp. TY815]|uniref:DUF4097 family beta strand repeat-containing protein n=1 Tax=Mycobacterium sp. TY815 TaxID=3050581 RepID=UPI0027407417|nr:DUF4097 family beta strand repeat-containing protein [Mycobacterium sp. TY815]MDP7702877.1 DUF4097 family beta strand repeat-containing protein [Mycobacterium sp. TY815]
MSLFTTPDPISVRVAAGTGSVRLTATDRTDTSVQLRPDDDTCDADVWTAEHVRVDFRDGRLTVSTPKRARHRGGAVQIDIALPSGSRVSATLGSAELRAEGDYSDVRVAAAAGDIDIDAVTGKLKSTSASGSLSVQRIKGYASIATSSGAVRVENLDGELKFKAASGSLSVDTLRGAVRSRTASGGVIVEAGIRGVVSAHTSSGEVAVGVPEGTAVRFDIVTGSGSVTNCLAAADGPQADDETLVLQVRSGSGDVHIHRDPAAAPAI